MRPLVACCLCVVWATGGAAEMQGIEHIRARETAVLDAQEAACYQRFAVSGCLQEVQSRRRAMLASLRRQEATLHEKELAERGAEQRLRSRQKAEERQAQQAQLLADQADAGSAEQQAHKLQVQKDKQAEHAAQAARLGASSARAAGVVTQAGGLTLADEAANRSSFARKQAQAEQKRQELARRLADKGGKSAAPLPLPQ